MAEHDSTEVKRGSSTALTVPSPAGPEMPAARVKHSMPFVAQLIANAHEPSTYRRRRSDHTKPLQAYAALGGIRTGGTRRTI